MPHRAARWWSQLTGHPLFAPLVRLILLLFLAGQLLLSAPAKSPTVDEPNHLTRGYVYLKTGDLRFSRTTGHPPLLNALCALPLTLIPEIGDPRSYPGWEGGFLNGYATTFVFNNPVPLKTLIWLGRLPVIAMTLILVALVGRWAQKLYGVQASLLVMILCVFDPNLIAHGRLATTDMGITLFFTLTLYLFWRWTRKPSVPMLIASGIALGLAQCAKFSAILLLPVLGLLGLLAVFSPPLAPSKGKKVAHWGRGIIVLSGAMAAMVVLAMGTIWAVYGFSIGPSEWNIHLPAPAYIEGLRTILTRVSTDRPTFLLGERLAQATWRYFPVALSVKTPLPSLLLLLAALLNTLWQKPKHREWPLIVMSGVYAATSLKSALNLGYRHILPMLPLLWIYVGRLSLVEHKGTNHAPDPKRWPVNMAWAKTLLILWLIAGTLSIAPNYLTFFNELAGGPEGGWRVLVDSNLDWGQDLYALAKYRADHSNTPLYLSWFGTTYPYLYDRTLDYQHLPGHYSFPYANEMARSPFNPLHPAPGLYAISTTNVQMGVAGGDWFTALRQREPDARIGGSIFIYEIGASTPDGHPTCISGIDWDELTGETQAQSIGRSGGWIKWFDQDRAFILPGHGEIAYVLPREPLNFAPDWQTLWLEHAEIAYKQVETEAQPAAVVYHLTESALLRTAFLADLDAIPPTVSGAARFDEPFDTQPMQLPVQFGDQLEFLGYRIAETPIKAGETVELITVWQVTSQIPPSMGNLKTFVHLLDVEGRVRGGEDRLDLAPLTWQAGDLLIQRHQLRIPGDAGAGTYQIELGLYVPDTMQRLLVNVDGQKADRLLLRAAEIE